MVRYDRPPRRLMSFQPGVLHPEWVKDVLAVDLVQRSTGRLLREDAADHVPGVRVLEALAWREAPPRVRGNVVHQLDRPPCPRWLLSQARGE